MKIEIEYTSNKNKAGSLTIIDHRGVKIVSNVPVVIPEQVYNNKDFIKYVSPNVKKIEHLTDVFFDDKGPKVAVPDVLFETRQKHFEYIDDIESTHYSIRTHTAKRHAAKYLDEKQTLEQACPHGAILNGSGLVLFHVNRHFETRDQNSFGVTKDVYQKILSAFGNRTQASTTMDNDIDITVKKSWFIFSAQPLSLNNLPIESRHTDITESLSQYHQYKDHLEVSAARVKRVFLKEVADISDNEYNKARDDQSTKKAQAGQTNKKSQSSSGSHVNVSPQAKPQKSIQQPSKQNTHFSSSRISNQQQLNRRDDIDALDILLMYNMPEIAPFLHPTSAIAWYLYFNHNHNHDTSQKSYLENNIQNIQGFENVGSTDYKQTPDGYRLNLFEDGNKSVPLGSVIFNSESNTYEFSSSSGDKCKLNANDDKNIQACLNSVDGSTLNLDMVNTGKGLVGNWEHEDTFGVKVGAGVSLDSSLNYTSTTDQNNDLSKVLTNTMESQTKFATDFTPSVSLDDVETPPPPPPPPPSNDSWSSNDPYSNSSSFRP